MLSWLFKRFKKTSHVEILAGIENEKELIQKTQVCYESLNDEDFECFYRNYFTFIVRLPNIEDTNKLLVYYKQLISNKQFISDIKLSEYSQYSTETFFIRENHTYINKTQSLQTLKVNVLALIDELHNYVDSENVDTPTYDYYYRRLSPILESLSDLVLAYLDKRVSMLQ